MMNGQEQPRDAERLYVIIPQDDLLFPSLTPRETFRFIARLRLGDDVSLEDKYEAVERIIERLSLKGCADTPVGSEDSRGLSGGEKKRTSIGCEVLVNPPILLVDEPTSGLDSETAHSVVLVLKRLAHDEGRTVITVIHQPAWRTFCLFDYLVLFQGGRVVYEGRAAQCEHYMSKIGYVAPERANPIDFYFSALQKDGGAAFHSHWVKEIAARSDGSFPAGGKAAAPQRRRHSLLPDILVALEAERANQATSRFTQFRVLLERATRDYVKDASKLQANLQVKVVIGVVVGIIWLNQARGKLVNRSTFIVEGAMFASVYTLVIETLTAVVQTYPLQGLF